MCKGEVWQQGNKKFEQICIGTMGQLLVVSQWIFQRPFLKRCMYKHNIKIGKPLWTSYPRTLLVNQRWNSTSPSLSKPSLDKLKLGLLGILSLPTFTNEPLTFVLYVKVSHMNFRCLLEVVYKLKKLLIIKSTPRCLPSKLKVWPQSTHLGKIIVIGVTQVSGHSLKLHFCMFERSQGKHNSLDCHKFLEYFPLIVKFTCSKLDSNQKCFCMFKALKLWEWTILVFFKCLFFLSNVHHSFWKLERF